MVTLVTRLSLAYRRSRSHEGSSTQANWPSMKKPVRQALPIVWLVSPTRG